MTNVNLGTATGSIVFNFVGSGIDAAVGGLSTLTGAADNTSSHLSGVGVAFTAMGAAISDALIHAANDAILWQSQMAQLNATTYESSQSQQQNAATMNLVSEGIRQIALSTPASITSIAQLTEVLAQQGIRGQALVQSTKSIIDLNRLTGVSTQELASGITKFTQAYALGADGVSRMSNALFEVSRTTHAAIPDILNFANRLVGVAAAAGLAAPDLLALAAEYAAMPSRARIAVTAIEQFISTVSRAGPGTREFQTFVRVTGESVQQLAQQLRDQPIQAINAFLVGLDRLKGGFQAQTEALSELNLAQPRQIETLVALAHQQTTAAQSGESLADMIAIVNAAWQNNNSIQSATQRIYGTTASQLTELHNAVTEAGQALGADFLPVINAIIGPLKDFFVGVQTANPVVRDFAVGFLSLTAATLTLGGGFLLLAPKIAAGLAVYRQWRSEKNQDTAETAANIAANDAAAEAVATTGEEGSVAAQGIAILVSQLDMLLLELGAAVPDAADVASTFAIMGSAAEAAVPGVEGLDVALAETDAEVTVATGGLNLILPALLALAAVAGIATTGMTALSGANALATDNANKQAQADQGLQSALQREANGVKGATDAWLLNKLAQDGVLSTAVQNGISGSELIRTITGVGASAQTTAQFLQHVQEAYQGNTDGADKLLNELKNLNGIYGATVDATNALARSEQSLGDSSNGAGNSTDDLTRRVQTLQQQAQEAANAASNFASDLLNEQAATLSVADATEKLYAAQTDAAHAADALKTAEDELAKSQLDVLKSQNQLAQDQVALSQIQQRQAEDLAKAQLSVEQADLQQKGAALSLAEAQQRLSDLMNGSAINDYAKAINSLHDAEANLYNSTQGVADAQWQLNYLIEEGASPRDIADAQETLTEALNKQRDAQTGVNDAQQKVNDLPTQQALNLAKAQQDVANAELQVQQSALSAQQAQQGLADIQQQIATNSAYVDALDKVAQDHLAIDQAIQQVTKDQESLHAIQNGSVERSLQSAQQGLAQAVLQEATATTNAERDQAAMNGQLWTAADYADHLATNLSNINGQAGPMSGLIRNAAGAMENGADSARHFGDAADGLNKQLGDVNKNVQNLQNQTNNVDFGAGEKALSSHTSTLETIIVGYLNWAMQSFNTLFGWLNQQIDALPGVAQGIVGLLGGGVTDLAHFVHGASGFIVNSPTLAYVGEAGTEVLLPLNDPQRMLDLLSASGGLESIMSILSDKSAVQTAVGASGASGASLGPSLVNPGGDTFHISTVVQDANSIADEIMWAKAVRPL